MPVPWYLRSCQEKQLILRTLRFYIVFFLSLFCFYQVFTSFILCSYRTKSETMTPTINRGDYLLIKPIHSWFYATNLKSLKRGEIVLIDISTSNLDKNIQPFHWSINLFDPFIKFLTLQHISLIKLQKSPEVPTTLFLKRVVGTSGDWIKIENGMIYVKTKNFPRFVTEFESSNFVYEINSNIYHKNNDNHQENIEEENWKISTLFSPEFSEFQLMEDQIFVLGDNRKQINDSRIFGPIPISSIRGRLQTTYWPIKKVITQSLKR